jgi:hypothetical protein
MIKNIAKVTYLFILGSAVLSSVHAASIIAYVEAPSVQATTVPGSVTTDFEGLAPGIYATPLSTTIGTYDAAGGPAYAIVNANA